MKGRARALVLAGLVLVSLGCGYRLVGQNTFLPERIRVVAVLPFGNRTTRPEIEQRVTEAVSLEFSKRHRYRVVTAKEGSDAVLEGTITGFRTNPVKFSPEGRAERVETIVTLDATLRDASDAVLWSQAGLLFRSQYDVQSASTPVVGATGEFFDQETLALDDLAKGAASLLVSSLLEGF